MSSTNRGRALLIFLLVLIPLISYREDILLSIFYAPSSTQNNSGELAQQAFNSYKLNTPLFEAVKANNLELVRTLLTGGVDGKGTQQSNNGAKITYYNVNAEDPKGLTPLIEATLLGNVELVELLLIHGAKPTGNPGYRHTPLRAACLTGNTQLISLLLEKGAEPNAQSEGGRTPLMGACFLRPQYDESPDRIELSFEAVKAMLDDPRTDPTIKNDFGEGALDLCRHRGYDKSVVFLRDRITRGGSGRGGRK